jgi:hypothetical protein
MSIMTRVRAMKGDRETLIEINGQSCVICCECDAMFSTLPAAATELAAAVQFMEFSSPLPG